MNKTQAFYHVSNFSSNLYGRKLTNREMLFVKKAIKQTPQKYFTETSIKAVAEVIHQDLTKSFELAEINNVDIRDHQNEEIKDKHVVSEHYAKPRGDINISSIFDTRDSHKLLKVFNPSAMCRKTYFVLDRRYQARNSDNRSTFTWDLSYNGSFNDKSSAITRVSKFQDIVGVKMLNFRFPNTDNAITFSQRLSIFIEEIPGQAYILPNGRKFHFLSEIIQEGAALSLEPYKIAESSINSNEYSFHTPIRHLESITLSFGNPSLKLNLDPDLLSGVISAAGVQTLITFTTPHKANDGELIFLEDFNTSSPADYVEISMINNKFGWVITASTSTTITIDVDLSGLTGVINSNPSPVYLDGKRFIIPLVVTYLCDK